MNTTERYTPTTEEVRDAASEDGATAIDVDAFDRWHAVERNKARFDLQAVIAEAVAFASNDAYRGDGGVVDADEIVRILAQPEVRP